MAKLKAHGYEMLRMARDYTETNEFGPILYRETLSYRSDGHIMRNLKFLQTSPYAEGWHDFGWKLYQKLKPGIMEKRKAAGWTIQEAV